jgi:MFS family permease
VIARIVAAFAFGYFLSYLFRVVNAVAGRVILVDVDVGIGDLGLLTSVYFLTFAAVQLPLGVALDRYGPRRVQATLLLVAAIGAVVFATAGGLWTLVLGRGLIGIGVAGSLMAAFKAYSMTVPNERLPLVNGIHMAAGGLGALAGGMPAELVVDAIGWRELFFILAGLSVVAAGLVAVLGPRWQPVATTETATDQIRAVGRILRDPVFLRVAAFCVPSQATALAVQGLWAGPWLRNVQGLDTTTAAIVLSAMAAAMTCGFLAFGALSTRLAARGIPTLNVAIAGMIAFMVVQAGLVLLPANAGIGVWLAYSFVANSGILVFPALGAFFPATMGGRVNTALNFLVFTASFTIQWLIGVAVERWSDPLGLKGAFDTAFAILLALQVAGLVILLMKLPKRGATAQPSSSTDS